jgi:transcriptional regulator with XRE-family HTH domain
MSSTESSETVRLGATCRAFRIKRGLKVGEAATALTISYAYLSNIEAGRKPLTAVLLARMASLYGVPEIAIARPDLFEGKQGAAAERVSP